MHSCKRGVAWCGTACGKRQQVAGESKLDVSLHASQRSGLGHTRPTVYCSDGNMELFPF